MGAPRRFSHIPNYPPDLATLIAFADAVAKGSKFSEKVTTSTDPKVLYQRWKTVVNHKHGDRVRCMVEYLPEGGEFITGCRFFALDPEGTEWQSVEVNLIINEVERDNRPQRNYAGLRKMLDL